MKGIREVYTTEQLYEQLRPRLALSDAWVAEKHPDLLRMAEAMVEALQKKESYGGGVAQRAAHLAAHLKVTDPVLARWMEKQQVLKAAKAAREAAAMPAPTDSPRAGSNDGDTPATTNNTKSGSLPPPLPQQRASQSAGESARRGEAPGGATAGEGVGAVESGGARSGSGGGGSPSPGLRKSSSSSKGGAATALEYLTTTFAHLREQRTLVMGDKKDRLLKEVAGLRQLRAGTINVLRGGKASETTMADMLAALKAADADPRVVNSVLQTKPAISAADGLGAPMDVDAVPAGVSEHTSEPAKGYLDNLTCVVWEDWRVPERLDQLLRAGDSVCVYVEVHCRDGPEDTRLGMRLSTFVALALCSQRLIAELYQDMFITPQRAASSRPQRKRQRTVAEETVQTLDESPDSLDFVDFVEALHRRMPLRCGWMYANAILPPAGEWDRVFGRHAGRLSGLYEGGPELDALGRACLAFHHTRHESPVLDVHVLASHLRQQQQQWQQKQPAGPQQLQQQLQQRVPGGWPRSAVELATASVVAPPPCGSACSTAPSAAPSLILREPYDSSGRGQGLDLGHLSFTCVTAAPLSDDFLGEVIRQTTAGQAAAEVAAAAATAAALRASRCISNGRMGCTGTCVEDAAAAASAAAAAAAAAADYMSWGGLGGDAEEEQEQDLYEAVNEELRAVEEAVVEAEREVEMEMEMMEVQARVKREGKQQQQQQQMAQSDVTSGPAAAVGGLHLKGAFSHRMQLMPGVFFSYYIGSQAFTNTAWHVEDFLLQSINLMMVGRPKAWWWVPREKEAVFKEYLEDQWDAEDVYTKSVPLAGIPLDKLIKMGVRRSVQLPGAVFITSPGYAFHTTMSSGWSMADSANFMTNILGKDMHSLEDERPLEQYPATEGRTNTGEWVRFTMRRIEELRARNDPSYQPRPLRRIREQVQARRAAAAAAAAATATTGVSAPGIKAEPEDVAEDKMVTASSTHIRGVKQGHSHGHPHAHAAHKAVKIKAEDSGVVGALGPQSQPPPTPMPTQPQPTQQLKSRQRNDKSLLQAYVQAKAAHKAEAQAAANAAAQRRQARAAARGTQPQLPVVATAFRSAPAAAAAAVMAPIQVPAAVPAPPAPPAPAPAPAQAPVLVPVPVPAPGRKASSKVAVALFANRKEKPAPGGKPAIATAPTAAIATVAPMPQQQKHHQRHHHHQIHHRGHHQHHQQQEQQQQQQPQMPKLHLQLPKSTQIVSGKAEQQRRPQQLLLQQQQQQQQQQYQPVPVYFVVPEHTSAIEVQPQNFSEQELLAGLLPGVLRGLLPEATVMLQQQKQQQHEQRQRQASSSQAQAVRFQQDGMREYREQQLQLQQQEEEAEEAVPMEGVGVEDGAAGGVVAMDMPWRVAVA